MVIMKAGMEQVITLMDCLIFRPVRLLYHTTVDKKGISADAILSAAQAGD